MRQVGLETRCDLSIETFVSTVQSMSMH